MPETFGKYTLLERLSTGGMAEVHLARLTGAAGFEKHLVIKRIRDELAHDPRFVQMFINEAKIGVHLSHPNIIQTYELGRIGDQWAISMEYLDGRNLTQVARLLKAQKRRLSIELTVFIAAEICRGLAYAHSRTDAHGQPLGLVHRDVSPHNVMITYNGGVKVLDFGIAHISRFSRPVPDRRPGGGTFS